MAKWIQGAVKHPGSFTRYMHQKYGAAAFTQGGDLKVEYINKVKRSPSATTHRKRQANLALRLKKMRR